MNLTGVVLSGGKSLRMGTDKGLMLFNGTPMIVYAIRLLQYLTPTIVISTSNQDYNQFGYPLVSDLIADIGPISGLYSTMKQVKSDNYFFMACDLPFATNELAKRMLVRTKNYEIVVPTFGNNKNEPLFGFYSSKVLTVIKEQIDTKNYKLQDLLKRCNTLYFNIPEELMDKGQNLFKNVNSPEDAGK